MEMYEKIKSLRLAKGLTLEQVGDYVGVGKSTVRKWENGIIENMRRDKIAKLAHILGTTPDYLMGWETPNDEWSSQFRQSLSEHLSSTDCSKLNEKNADYDRLCDIAYGSSIISLSEACEIADSLGRSLDDMVGNKKSAQMSGIPNEDYQALTCFMSLSDDKRQQALDYLRFLAETSNK